MPKVAQQADEQRGAGRAVDVIVAINGHLFAAHHRLGQPFGGGVHVAEDRGIGQEMAERRIAVALDIFGRHAA